MCGIAGFSLTKHDADRIDSRCLAGMLLINIEHRGRDATGAAWTETTPDGLMWWYDKAPIPARKFGNHIQQMPKHTRRALLHVRFATTGDPADNDNNHPIIVPSESGGSVIGTHNGVLLNHEDVMAAHQFPWVGEVDSQVIFHLMGRDAFVRDDLRQLTGSMAIAAVDTSDPTVIRLARTVQRPLWLAQTPSGSVLWASEKQALLDAMKVVSLDAEFLMEVPEWTMITINNGRIEAVEQITRPVPPKPTLLGVPKKPKHKDKGKNLSLRQQLDLSFGIGS